MWVALGGFVAVAFCRSPSQRLPAASLRRGRLEASRTDCGRMPQPLGGITAKALIINVFLMFDGMAEWFCREVE